MTALHDLPGTRLLALFARRELSPSEYYEHLLAHIQRWEPHLNALYRFDPQRIREQAAAATERWRKGQPKGPLDGLPVTIKELIATAGEPIPLGSAATALQPATCDAPPAARLREAGAIVLAKTTVPDFGMLSSGLSSFHGVTRNPWNLANNTGGSSSGAAAAAAAGYGPLHLGTDIGGSVRLPAGWCGLVGFKPSLGRIPIDPYYTGRCAGPMTRCMDDCLLLMRYLAQPDARDATSLPPEVLDWSAEPLSVRGLRVGLQLDPARPRAARLFGEIDLLLTPTNQVEAFPADWASPLNDPQRPFEHIVFTVPWNMGEQPALSINCGFTETRRARVLPYVHAWAEGGARVSGVDAVRGFNQTFEMRRRAARLFGEIDLLLTPTNQVEAFPADWASPLNDPQRPFEHIVFTVPWNMGEQPALSINCGFTAAGMPIGLQLVAPRFADTWLLRIGKTYEGWRGPIHGWPRPPAD
ncbi:amidase [Pseudomonas aeruginosa]|nr:amidase [Pseudomonas aeruginosa]